MLKFTFFLFLISAVLAHDFWCGTEDPHTVHHVPPRKQATLKRDTQCTTCTWYQCELSSAFGETPPVCSNPSVRDQYLTTPSTPIILYSIIYVLRDSNGNNQIVSESDLDHLENNINSAFLPLKVQFEFERLYVHSNSLRYQIVPKASFNSFKTSVATAAGTPSHLKAIRIYISDLEGGLLGSATFPYEDDVLDVTGGFIMDYTSAQASANAVRQKTAPHEMGHCCGLYHTFQDGLSSSNNECKFCWWVLNQGHPSVALDESGDFCDDTTWLPGLHDDSDPDCYGGPDRCPIGDPDYPCTNNDCSGVTVTISQPLVEEDAKNYMSYHACLLQEFTLKQGARVRCFIDQYLDEAVKPDAPPSGWTCNPDWYNNGVACSCGCGIYDPDCNNPNLPTSNNCPNGETCDPIDGCTPAIPPGWTCLDSWYTDGDCDCGCGVYDPTCDNPNAPFINHCTPDDCNTLTGQCNSVSIASIYKVKVPKNKIKRRSALVKWVLEDPGATVDLFKLHLRKKKNGNWQSWSIKFNNIDGSLRKQEVTGLNPGTVYQARVRSKNSAGLSSWKKKKFITKN